VENARGEIQRDVVERRTKKFNELRQARRRERREDETSLG